MMTPEIEALLREQIAAKGPKSGEFAIAAGLLAVASSLSSIAFNIKYLGTGDASTSMGAIEFLAVALEKSIESFGDKIVSAADTLHNG